MNVQFNSSIAVSSGSAAGSSLALGSWVLVGVVALASTGQVFQASPALGQVAKATLSTLTVERKVSIECYGADRYRRQICKIKLEGLDINWELVARGMAWMYRRYNDVATYNAAEQVARAAKLGVWADSTAVPSWEFRRGYARN